MVKLYKDITDDEILNYSEAHTGQMAQYGRIMQHRTILALTEVRGQLNGLMGTLRNFNERLNETIHESSQAQAKQQKAIIALTIIIAISTLVYTGITWQSNSIQLQLLELEKGRAGEG